MSVTLIDVKCKEGDMVKKDDTIVVFRAMKMEKLVKLSISGIDLIKMIFLNKNNM